MVKKTIVTAVAIAMGLAIGSAGAGNAWNQAGGEKNKAMILKPDLKNGLEVYKVCSQCHMPEGWGMTEGNIPQLAGQHRSILIKQLSDIRSMNRDNPTMFHLRFQSPSVTSRLWQM